MIVYDLIRLLELLPKDLQVVTYPQNEYDEDGEITNYCDLRVRLAESCTTDGKVVYIHFKDELIDM